MLSAIAIEAVAAAAGDVLFARGNAVRKKLLWWRRKPQTAEIPPLTGEQARQLRDACQRHAVALGLPPASAEILADAVLGRFAAVR